jgi:hypothetical protein
MNVLDRLLTGTFRVFSLEDDAEALRATLRRLEYDGQEVLEARDLDGGREILREEPVSFLILDQVVDAQIGEKHEGGSRLLRELKQGALGPLNVWVPFVFVTGSREWLDVEWVEALPGFMGIELKGDDVTPRVRRHVVRAHAHAAQIPPPDEEDVHPVVLRVEGLTDGLLGEALQLFVPAWDATGPIEVPAAQLEGEAEGLLGEDGQWFTADFDFAQAQRNTPRISNIRYADDLDDDDGLA